MFNNQIIKFLTIILSLMSQPELQVIALNRYSIFKICLHLLDSFLSSGIIDSSWKYYSKFKAKITSSIMPHM